VRLSGFLIGGAIPAACLGLGTVFMRASAFRKFLLAPRYRGDRSTHGSKVKRHAG